jgi:hypothetical protein
MFQLLLPLVAIALIWKLVSLIQDRRERDLLERIEKSGHNTTAILSEFDSAIESERAREEFWKRQNPAGGPH